MIWGASPVVPTVVTGDDAPVFDQFSAGDLAHAASFAVVSVAVVGERVWFVARDGNARLRPLLGAIGLLAGALVVGGAAAPVLRSLWAILGGLAPGPLVAAVDRHPVVAFTVGFVAWDLAGYWHHRIGHHVRLGWASHRWHHTGPEFDLSVALRQSWLPWPALVTFPFVAVTGVSFTTAAVCAAVSNTWQALTHLSIPIRLGGVLDGLVVTPASHRRHHETREPVNLGAVLTIWDRLAGTWVAPDVVGDLRAGHATDWTIGDSFRPNHGG